MSAGGKRVGSGRKKSEPTKLKTFRIPFQSVDKYDEIVERIKALISFYSEA
jgi:hypothetical protein